MTKENPTPVKFDKATERGIIALGRKGVLKNVLLILLIIGFSVGVYVAAANREDSSYDDPMSILYLTISILPFYPFRLHERLFTKTFYGTVTKREFAVETERNKYQFFTDKDNIFGEKVIVTFTSDDGETVQIYTYNEPQIIRDACYYGEGDRVLVAKGSKYPVKCPLPDLIVCPSCGHFINNGERKCEKCKSKF